MAAPKRTAEQLRSEIRDLRRNFIGTRESRAAVLEDALDQLRAETVARQIIALEGELEQLTK